MQQLALITRFLTFCVFFFAGAAAMVLSIIAEPELVNYYRSRGMLVQIQQQNARIKSLTSQYDQQIETIEKEPQILERFGPVTFGRKPAAPDTLFPQASNPDLKSETELVLEHLNAPVVEEPVPYWLRRILEPKMRNGLFLSGSALVLTTFIFFGTPKGKFLERA
ncbi:MAG: hypothetical protein LLF76_03570 [Planctomycetaceae bacterium]|nr:hypothetical protein [Planctomycetaceae bacterium]